MGSGPAGGLAAEGAVAMAGADVLVELVAWSAKLPKCWACTASRYSRMALLEWRARA